MGVNTNKFCPKKWSHLILFLNYKSEIPGTSTRCDTRGREHIEQLSMGSLGFFREMNVNELSHRWKLSAQSSRPVEEDKEGAACIRFWWRRTSSFLARRTTWTSSICLTHIGPDSSGTTPGTEHHGKTHTLKTVTLLHGQGTVRFLFYYGMALGVKIQKLGLNPESTTY